MKKGIIALSILCTGLLLLDPVKNMSFASKDDNIANKVNTNTNIVNKVEENDKNENIIDNKELHNENDTISKNENIAQENKDKEEQFKEDKAEDINKEEEIKPEVIVNENKEVSNEEESKENTSEEEKQVLSKEEAEQLLININPELEYLYQGDENNFSALKEKNLTGYVFLPNVDGDIGYFIDKTNSDVYFFHRSGYLELVK